MKLVDMEVQDIEIARAITDPVEHKHVIGDGIPDIGAKAQRHRGTGRQFGPRVESPLANKVTSWPSRTSSSVRYETILSVPP